MTFKELSVGQSFDWINDAKPGWNSFFRRCVKVGERRYKADNGYAYRVGSVNAEVFHVAELDPPREATDHLCTCGDPDCNRITGHETDPRPCRRLSG